MNIVKNCFFNNDNKMLPPRTEYHGCLFKNIQFEELSNVIFVHCLFLNCDFSQLADDTVEGFVKFDCVVLENCTGTANIAGVPVVGFE